MLQIKFDKLNQRVTELDNDVWGDHENSDKE